MARRAGTLVSFGMLLGVIAGCGTRLDPRLQPNDDLREKCAVNGIAFSDEKIRGILAAIEQRRLMGATVDDEFDAYLPICNQEYQNVADRNDCYGCHSVCVTQVFSSPF